MDLLLIIFGLLYGSFQLYYSRAKESGSTKQKNREHWNKIAVRWIKFCCVISWYLLITLFMNQVFEGFFLYTLARGVILIWLMYNNSYGASAIFDFSIIGETILEIDITINMINKHTIITLIYFFNSNYLHNLKY